MNAVSIEPADVDHLHDDMALRRLSEDLSDNYRANPDEMADARFGKSLCFVAMMARARGKLCGVAVFSPAFPKVQGQAGIFGFDLWVNSGNRNAGLATPLPQESFKEGQQRYNADFIRSIANNRSIQANRFHTRLRFVHVLGGDKFQSILGGSQ